MENTSISVVAVKIPHPAQLHGLHDAEEVVVGMQITTDTSNLER